MAQGIYEIYCLRNNKRYIGSSKDMEKRWNDHVIALKYNMHHNRFLQEAWNRYGESEFVFTILEEVNDNKDLFKREEVYIKKFKFNSLFNIMCKPGAVPRRTSKWTKMNNAKKKKKQDEEFAWIAE